MKATVLLLLVAVSGLVATATPDDQRRPIQILQLNPQTEEQLLDLIHLFETGDLDFWRAPSKINATVDIMVDARQRVEVESFALEHNLKPMLLVPDLEAMISEREGEESWRARALHFLRGGRRDLTEAGLEDFGMNMAEYHSYGEIVSWLTRIEARLPGKARVWSIGRTSEGREITGIRLGNPVGDVSKRVVWIDGGIHAREWTAVHTTVYIIFKLANGILRNDAKTMAYLEQLEVVVLPVLNPDGYEYTRSDPRNALVRMWRKSRSQERCATNKNGETRCCQGVDLNRNFAYRFAETGTSFHPCSEIYHGAGPFSEPESRAVRDAITNSAISGRIDAYVSLHAYSQLWIYPYSNRRKSYPADVAELKKVAQKAVSAIGRLFGTHYLYGTGPEIIYAYTGGSSDWAKETAKIKYSYTIELRPSYFSWNGFVLEKSQLIPTARETYDGILVVLDTVSQETRDRALGIVRPPAPVTAPPPTPTLPPPLPQGVCRDQEKSCARWIASSPLICSTSRVSMKRQCALSCRLC